jgi:hypothetical protein
MCSSSVEPMPSMMSSPKRSRQRSNVMGGSGSAADTHSRTPSIAPSAPGSRTRSAYSPGTLKNTVGRCARSVARIDSGFDGPFISTDVAPNQRGNDSPFPRP